MWVFFSKLFGREGLVPTRAHSWPFSCLALGCRFLLCWCCCFHVRGNACVVDVGLLLCLVSFPHFAEWSADLFFWESWAFIPYPFVFLSYVSMSGLFVIFCFSLAQRMLLGCCLGENEEVEVETEKLNMAQTCKFGDSSILCLSRCMENVFESHLVMQDFGVICLYKSHAEACSEAARAGFECWSRVQKIWLDDSWSCFHKGFQIRSKFKSQCWSMWPSRVVLVYLVELKHLRWHAGGLKGIDFATVDAFQGIHIQSVFKIVWLATVLPCYFCSL